MVDHEKVGEGELTKGGSGWSKKGYRKETKSWTAGWQRGGPKKAI